MADKTDEILIHLQYLRQGVDGLNERMDTLNGRTRASEQKIAVLEARVDDAKDAGGQAGRNWGAGAGAAGGFLGGVLAGAIQKFMGGGQ